MLRKNDINVYKCLKIYDTKPREFDLIFSSSRSLKQLFSLNPFSAQQLQSTNKCLDVKCEEIINNTGNMEYNDTTKQLSVSFRLVPTVTLT
jgi:hypothetical protein